MITLFTAAPGGGKTASMVDYLRTVAGDRPIFSAGINGLVLPHEVLDPNRWHEDVPDGAIIAIDEVQEYWRPAGPGARIPDAITALEKHRHRGIDVYMTTQHPRLLHTNVRSLVGRHVHIRDLGVLGRFWYEWPEVADNPSSAWKNAPLKKRFRLPKSAFALYKSASVHIKPVRSFPMMIFVVAACLIGVAAVVWYLFGSVRGKITPKPPAVTAPAADHAPMTEAAQEAAPMGVSDVRGRVPVGKAAFLDAVVPQQSWPLAVAGCWMQGDECSCVTREDRPRVITDRPALCLAVVMGDLQPPPGLPRPERTEPVAVQSAASEPGSV